MINLLHAESWFVTHIHDEKGSAYIQKHEYSRYIFAELITNNELIVTFFEGLVMRSELSIIFVGGRVTSFRLIVEMCQ